MPVAINFPTNRRIYGVNILVTYGDLGWASSWNWSATQTLLNRANTLGANCIKMLGDAGSVYRGEVTLANYLARWQQILDHCRSIGMHVYPSALDPDPQFLQDTPIESTIDTVSNAVSLFDDYIDIVIGIDLASEATSFGMSLEDMAALYNACHPLTSLGLTFSRFFPSAPDPGGTDFNDRQSITDFCDMHLYYAASISEFDGLRFHNNTKDFIIGEFGSPLSAGESTRTALYNANLQVANAGVGTNLTPIRGALAWELQSQPNSPNDSGRWGIYAADGTPYSYLVDSFQKNKLVFRPATFGGAMHGGQLHSAPLHADELLPVPAAPYVNDQLLFESPVGSAHGSLISQMSGER